MTTRRRLLSAALLGALHAPSRVMAQTPAKVWRIGLLSPIPRPRPDEPNPYTPALVQAMQKLGYAPKKDYVVELRSADGDYARLPALAAELVQARVDVIVAWSSIAVQAAQGATKSIPIIFMGVHDPVGMGLVQSLAHPGGNTTGLATFQGMLVPKHLELLRVALPKLSRVAVLVNPQLATHDDMLKSAQEAGRQLRVTMIPVRARNEQELAPAFAAMARARAGAVIVISDPFFNQQRHLIAGLALKHRLPSVFGAREDVVAGGLLSYGDSTLDMFRRVPLYLDKIFKGTPPGDLPVEQPMVFHLALNRKTAQALGMAVSQELILRADEVIE